jgi:predicted nucleotidyltransferase
MATKHRRTSPASPAHIYWGADIPMRVIRRFARAVGAKFRPSRIILFGSHASGRPHVDSDVDILVVMQARNKHSQAVRIRQAVSAPFPMDLLVRTPEEVNALLQQGDTFMTDVVSKGKILYEAVDPGVGPQGGG